MYTMSSAMCSTLNIHYLTHFLKQPSNYPLSTCEEIEAHVIQLLDNCDRAKNKNQVCLTLS